MPGWAERAARPPLKVAETPMTKARSTGFRVPEHPVRFAFQHGASHQQFWFNSAAGPMYDNHSQKRFRRFRGRENLGIRRTGSLLVTGKFVS
jgi:hypothetical protein